MGSLTDLVKETKEEAKPEQKPIPKSKKIPKIKEQPQKEEPKPEVHMTIDGLRGLKLLATGIGDKTSDKPALEQELKRRLFNPNEFAHFLKNLASYLESI